VYSTATGDMGTMAQPAEHYPTEVVISSDLIQARLLQDDIERDLRGHHYADREVFSIRLAVEEAIINAIKHGNGMDRAKAVRIGYRVAADRFDIEIIDEGCGFCPDDLPDPTAVENLERPCGRGVLLMRHYMTTVEFNERGNRVCMSKVRQDSHLNNGKK
jgi:serine/threonine-protein kinase RsbW